MPQESHPRILVYGAEKVGLSAPKAPIEKKLTKIHFEPIDTASRFQEFDGVILFQGIFETFERRDGVMESYLVHTCDRNELDKRKKEADLLVRNGGILCFLLTKPFYDRGDGRSYEGTDLAKFHLNHPNFYRENFSGRIAHLRIMRDEFRKFLEVNGAASAHFHHYSDRLEWHVLAEAAGRVCAMVIERNEYFVPTLIPDNRPEVLEEYFSELAAAILATTSKLNQQAPGWVNSFPFDEEEQLRAEVSSLESRLKEVSQEQEKLQSYKGILAFSGEKLVDAVGEVLSSGFGFKIQSVEKYIEDLKLIAEDGRPWCICEVKGVNGGIRREHINQTDSHRERAGFPQNFPSVLIVNAFRKTSGDIEARDQELAKEQVKHAVSMQVLILRTLDLLRLLRLQRRGAVSRAQVTEILRTSTGWLRVNDTDWRIERGENES